MTFEQSSYNRYQVLHLSGEVDLYNSPEVRRHVLALLKKSNAIAVDFAKLTYIDSSGIATLVEALNLARDKGGELVIVGATGAPKQVLELTRLDKVFSMFESFEQVPR